MSTSSSEAQKDLLDSLFKELNLSYPDANSSVCLYRSGFLDSADLLQLLLLIEQSTPGRVINLEEILTKEITVKLLNDLLYPL